MKATAAWIAVAMSLATLLRVFVGQACVVTSSSMEPGLLRGDVILVSKIAGDVGIDDIVVFRPEGMRELFVKRVVGMRERKHVTGKTAGDERDVRLFVMGDNRDDSVDSRVPAERGGAGFVPLDNVVGEAKLVVLSVESDFSLLRPWTWYRVRHDRWFKVIA